MLTLLLQAHSIWRWVVLILIIFVTVKALVGWLRKQEWTELDANLVRYTRFIVYFQVVLGILLFISLQKWLDMRFFGEHVIVALLAVGGIEFGAARAKKVSGSANKFKFEFIGFVIALVLILVAIGGSTQWTFM